MNTEGSEARTDAVAKESDSFLVPDHQSCLRRVCILRRTERFVAVDKPAGVLVHKSELAGDRWTVMQGLRDALGRHVFPVHRLDRKTSGVLVFALDAGFARELGTMFEQRKVTKRYLAIVRGWLQQEVVVDRALRKEDGHQFQEASTWIGSIATAELPVSVGPFASARFSLVEAVPRTGRRHQIRRHLRGLNHPVIGDTVHGEGRQNRLFREHLNCHRMLLHAWCLELEVLGERIEAVPDDDFLKPAAALGWDLRQWIGGQ